MKEEFKQIFSDTLTDEEFTEKENELKDELNRVIRKWTERGYGPILKLKPRLNGFMCSWIEKVTFTNREENIVGVE